MIDKTCVSHYVEFNRETRSIQITPGMYVSIASRVLDRTLAFDPRLEEEIKRDHCAKIMLRLFGDIYRAAVSDRWECDYERFPAMSEAISQVRRLCDGS